MVVTEKKAGKWPSSMRPQFMKTSRWQSEKLRKFTNKRSKNRFFQKIHLYLFFNQMSKITSNCYGKSFLKTPVTYLGLSCPPSMYICQNLIYPSWLAVANTVPSGDRAPSLTRCKGGNEKMHTIGTVVRTF